MYEAYNLYVQVGLWCPRVFIFIFPYYCNTETVPSGVIFGRLLTVQCTVHIVGDDQPFFSSPVLITHRRSVLCTLITWAIVAVVERTAIIIYSVVVRIAEDFRSPSLKTHLRYCCILAGSQCAGGHWSVNLHSQQVQIVRVTER